jgi:hypothetical protein
MKRILAFTLVLLLIFGGCVPKSNRRAQRDDDIFDRLAETEDHEKERKEAQPETAEALAQAEEAAQPATEEAAQPAAAEEMPVPFDAMNDPPPAAPAPAEEPAPEPVEEPVPEPAEEPAPRTAVVENGVLTAQEIEPREAHVPEATILSWSGSFEKEGQIDSYTFTTERDGVYCFFFTDILDGQEYAIRLTNAAGNAVHNAQWYDTYGLDEAADLTLKKGQTYTLSVKQKGAYYGGYTINVGVQKEYLAVGDYTAIYDSFEYVHQQNGYTFVPEVSGPYRFGVLGLPEGYSCGIQVVNAAGKAISNALWYDSYSNKEGQEVNLSAGQTYVVKYRESGYRGPYCVEVGLYKRVGDVSGVFAVDDSIQFLNQQNLYTFVPEQTASYQFGFSGIPEGYAYMIQVVNPVGNSITNGRWYDSYGNHESQWVDLTAGQTYTIIVRPRNALYGKYRLDISAFCAPVDVKLDKPVQDAIRFRLQRNMYTFTPEVDGSYSIELSGIPPEYSYGIQVWNGIGQIISNGNWYYVYKNGESQTLDLKCGQTYTIIVKQNGNFLSDYTLLIHR